MYIGNVPIQIKEGFKEQFVAGIKENASHAPEFQIMRRLLMSFEGVLVPINFIDP